MVNYKQNLENRSNSISLNRREVITLKKMFKKYLTNGMIFILEGNIVQVFNPKNICCNLK